jgi:hypothetical protein
MADNAGNQALWLVMKCVAADIAANPIVTTGNAGRIYGATSGIASATIATSPTKLLADAVTAA